MDERKRIKSVLSSALDIDVEVHGSADGLWDLVVAGGPRRPRLRAMWLGRGWPADVEAAMSRAPKVTLVAAPRLSPGARELLDARHVNWVDETGSARIRTDGILVHVDRDAPAPEPRPRQVRWSAAARRAGEAVLLGRPEQIGTVWIAEHGRCSVARASAILQSWDAAGWTVKHGPPRGLGAHRTLEQPGALLASWAEALNSRPIERWFAHSTTHDLPALQHQLGMAFGTLTVGWTGWAAAEQLAPFVTQLPVLHLRISEEHPRRELQSALREAGVTLTEDAGRIELWHTPTDGFLHATPSPDGPVMPWPWVFADLRRIGGRAGEAAEHLRETMEDRA